jgi:uncharacterized protein (TIGR03435 family)
MKTGPARTAEAGQPSDLATASEPSWGYTIFEAVDKQLGLKLEIQKRPVPVIVVDHPDQKATDN